MAFEQKEMQALIITSPDKAKKQILAALKSSGVHMGHAATALGCAHVTLLRWIAKLDIGDDVDAMKARAVREGWYAGHKGGRPKGSTVASGRAKPRTKSTSDRSDARA